MIAVADRAVSTVVGYVLALGILAILVSSLLVSFAPFVTAQQEGAAQGTLAVFGNDLAGDIDAADRLATRAGQDGTVHLRTRLPERVGDSTYEIEIDGDNRRLVLRADDNGANAIVHYRTSRDVVVSDGSTTVSGGTILIEYDASNDTLVIHDA